jgi:glutamine synthetase
MITKYVTSTDETIIRKVEVSRETEFFIVRQSKSGQEFRDAKRSQYQNYFDTHAQAKAFLLQHYTVSVESKRRALEIALEYLQKVQNLEE